MSYINPSFFAHPPGVDHNRPRQIPPTQINYVGQFHAHGAIQPQFSQQNSATVTPIATSYTPAPNRGQAGFQSAAPLPPGTSDNRYVNSLNQSYNADNPLKRERSSNDGYYEDAPKKSRTDISSAAKDAELRQLMHQLAQTQRQSEENRAKCVHLEAELKQQQSQNADKLQQMQKAQTEADDMRKLMRALHESVDSLSKRNLELTSRQRVFDDEMATYKLQVSTLTEKNTFITKRNETLLGKCEKLQKEIATTNASTSAECETLRKKLAESETKLKQSEAHSKTHMAAVARFEETVLQLKVQLAEMQSKLEAERPKVLGGTMPVDQSIASSSSTAPAVICTPDVIDTDDARIDYRALRNETQRIFQTYRSKIEETYNYVEDMMQKLKVIQMTGEHSSSSAFDAPSSSSTQLVQSTLPDVFAVNSSNLQSILARHSTSRSSPVFEPAPLLQQPLLARFPTPTSSSTHAQSQQSGFTSFTSSKSVAADVSPADHLEDVLRRMTESDKILRHLANLSQQK